jgi:phage terminase large subunit-like protein
MPNAFGVPSNDQVGFLNSTATERWILGGNRSGKTEVTVADCIWFATGIHPVKSLLWRPPVKLRYCAPSYEDGIKGVILPKFHELIKRSDLRGGSFDKSWSEKNKTLYLQNGTTINFKSFEQRVNKFGGVDLHGVYSDEHGGKAYYRENKARLADYGGFYVSSMTPEEGAVVWEKRHLKKRRGDNVEMWKFSTFGNPHLSPAGVKELEASIDDPRVLRVKLYGDFSALAGLVYEQWDEDVHVIEPRDIPDTWYRVFAIDPHIKKASAMLWGVWTPEDDLIFYRCAKLQKPVEELKQYIRAASAGERISLWLGDEAMGGDGKNIFGQDSVLKQLRADPNGIPIQGTNQASDKSFMAGVVKIRQMLTPEPVSRKPSLYVFSDCYDLIDEFDEYQFIPDSKADEMTFRERVRKVDDDLMDCARYIAMAGPGSGEVNIRSGLEGTW